MTSTVFYLASTPLHVFLSSAIALSKPQQRHHLLLIDQPVVVDNLYKCAVESWQDSPFSNCYIFPGQIPGTVSRLVKSRNKLRLRKKIFQQLKELTMAHRPSHILVGNDRRIEFQYCMHVAEQWTPRGGYIDEGTFTYVGRSASGKWSDKYVDNLIKKIVYGFWWSNPPTIGASKWIQDVYVAFPDLIHPLLKAKKVHCLYPDLLSHKGIGSLSEKIITLQNYNAKSVSSLGSVFVLPHESILKKSQSFQHRWLESINRLCSKSDRYVGVKYHPRDTAEDLLGISNIEGVHLIPKKINFEALIPSLADGAQIIGDFSSVLINARWLKPSLKIVAIDTGESGLTEQFRGLYKALSIQLIKPETMDTLE